MTVQRLAVLGSTGSIGENTLRVARALGPDRIRVSMLAAGRRLDRLAEQAREFHPSCVVTGDESLVPELKKLLPGVRVYGGMRDMCAALHGDDIDTVLCAIAGSSGLLPAVESLRAGKRLALATKEALVMGGRLINDLEMAQKTRVFPVDSEHSAIFQCLEGRAPETVRELILTASGGPFRTLSPAELKRVTWEQALRHPTWSMGPKVSVDSATLMNKALELIEAKWLFHLPPESISAVIHPQSIVHSLVRFRDGAVLAQLGAPDMRLPIQYALTWPDRIDTALPPLDLAACGPLTFDAATPEKYPALGLAKRAMEQGGISAAVLNAANEAALLLFQQGVIRFTDICPLVERAMDAADDGFDERSVPDILEAAREARALVLKNGKR